MKQLSFDERLEVYKKALVYGEKRPLRGFCRWIHVTSSNINPYYDLDPMCKRPQLRELRKYNFSKWVTWFPCSEDSDTWYNYRLNVLREIIREMEDIKADRCEHLLHNRQKGNRW